MSAKHQEGGERSSKDDREAPNPIQIQKFLGGLDYPVSKQDLIGKAKEAGAEDNVLEALERIPDQDYESPVAVSREVGRL
jgi:hypothetical protein